MKGKIVILVIVTTSFILLFSGCTQKTYTVSSGEIQINAISPILAYDKIIFNAYNFSDPDGQISSYSWDFGDDYGDTGVSNVHYYEESGSYTVKLSVLDDDGDLIKVVEKTISIIDTPTFSMTLEQKNKNDTTGVIDFRFTIAATTNHDVKISDVSLNTYFYIDGSLVTDLTASLYALDYYDYDNDGCFSAGDRINYTYNPVFAEPYSDNVTSVTFSFEYETHFAVNVNGPAALGEVSWNLS